MLVRVGVLYGGQSEEHAISVSSYKSFSQEMAASSHEIKPVYISKSGEWQVGGDSFEISEVIKHLQDLDVVFSLLHGANGEDGTMQGFLKTLGVPFVGFGVSGSVISMDKHLSKLIAQEAGINVVPYTVLFPHSEADEDALVKRHGLPMFVKPSASGSSCGISKVACREGIREAIEKARNYSEKVLIETYIDGREIECSVVGGKELFVSVPGEVEIHREFYCYNTKYHDEGGSTLKVCANLSPHTTNGIQNAAKEIFLRIDGGGYARVDFFLKGEILYFNEINSIPGFTNISLFPAMCVSRNLSYVGLIERIIR